MYERYSAIYRTGTALVASAVLAAGCAETAPTADHEGRSNHAAGIHGTESPVTPRGPEAAVSADTNIPPSLVRDTIVAGQRCTILSLVDNGAEGLVRNDGSPDPDDRHLLAVTVGVERSAEAASAEQQHQSSEAILTYSDFDAGVRSVPGDRNTWSAVDWMYPTSPYQENRNSPTRELIIRPLTTTPAGTRLILSMTVYAISPDGQAASMQDCGTAITVSKSTTGIKWELETSRPPEAVAPMQCFMAGPGATGKRADFIPSDAC